MNEFAGPAGLVEDASVSLALHDGKTALECTVIGFHRTLVVLRHAAPTSQSVLQRAGFGYVIFDTADAVAALRVEIIQFSDQHVTIRIVDRFDFSRQRRYSRLRASWPVVLEPLVDGQFGDSIVTTTIDVSAGGAQVQCAERFHEGQAFRATLQLPDATEDVSCAAEALHADGQTVTLRFIGLSNVGEAVVARAILNELAARASSTEPLDVDFLRRTTDVSHRQASIDKLIATASAHRDA